MKIPAKRAALWSAPVCIVGVALTPALARPSAAHVRPTPQLSLCSPSEATVFACPIGQKVVSVCSTRRPDKSVVLRYVYGKLGKPELSLANTAGSGAPMTSGSLAYSGGGGDYVRVRNGPYAYVVYSAMGRGWEQEGLVVEKDGRRISAQTCGGARAALGPNGWQDVYAAHLPDDKAGFEKPD